MNFGEAFSYVFEDPDWFKKILIAGAISIIPIIGQMVVYGWALEITGQLIRREAVRLPEMDFGTYLARGFKAFVITLVYALPAILVSGVLNGATAALGNNSNSDAMASMVMLVSLCSGLFSLVYNLIIALVTPAAFGNFMAKSQSIGDGLRLSEIFGLVRLSPTSYIIALLGGLVSGLVASLGLIACFIGVFLTFAYSMVVNAHLWGQAYVDAQSKASPATY